MLAKLLATSIAVSIFFSCTLLTTYSYNPQALFNSRFWPSLEPEVGSRTYVVSLPSRQDRRNKMEAIRIALGISWEYVDALGKEEDLVSGLMEQVKRRRRLMPPNATFAWPKDLLERSIALLDTDLNTLYGSPLFQSPLSSSSLQNETLLSATDNWIVPLPPDADPIPFYLTLSRGMVACWYSHLGVIQSAARDALDLLAYQKPGWTGNHAIALVFEDDIDMEWDIKYRIAELWDELPPDWDIVMLGSCWSNEALQSPISPSSSLHPSSSPKCTHAYALSSYGAIRLFSYLTYPPFAFSRALDQAIAYLISSGRLKSFTVVPSIVTQIRMQENCEGPCTGDSDIWVGQGVEERSTWHETLQDSTLARIKISEEADWN